MDIQSSQGGMKWHQKLAYSFGHIFNDLCSAMWFSLLLVFLTYVVHFPDSLAGYLLLWGQIVDAISTPLIGFESDRVAGIRRIGKRKSWHLLGTIAVGCSFPFIFMRCLGCEHSASWAQFIYYAPFVAVFQFGWASTQIAHMSLISQLSTCSSEKTELSGLRNAGTLLSSIIVFSAGWGFFGPDKGKEWGDSDVWHFTLLMIIVIIIGGLCSLVFLICLHEDNTEHGSFDIRNTGGSCFTLTANSMLWLDWLKEPQFYLVALLYMLSRLIVNVTGTYWAFFVLETLHMDKKYMVIIPLVVNITGFVISLLMRRINDIIGRKVSMLIGVLVTVGGCVWVWTITFFHTNDLQVIGPAILIGAGGSILIVSSLSMTTDIIGSHNVSGAFVFGAMSLSDKLACGTAIMLIQQFCPCGSHQDLQAAESYYNIIMVYVIVGFCAAQLVVLVVLWPQKLGRLRKLTYDDEEVTVTDDSHPVADAAATNDESRHLLNGFHRTLNRSRVGVSNGSTSPPYGTIVLPGERPTGASNDPNV